MTDEPKLYLLTPTQLDWWNSRGISLPATVLIGCGQGGCRKTVGEVRSDDAMTLALMHHRHGDRTVPYTPRQTEETLGLPHGMTLPELAEQQDRKFEALATETIKYLTNEQRVARRYNAGDIVFPLDVIVYIVCPDHGMIDLPDPKATAAKLGEFVSDTKPGSRRRYLAMGTQ